MPTLILVDRTPLVEQWKSRLMEHLGLGRRQIGRVASPAKPSGIIDIATAAALTRRLRVHDSQSPAGTGEISAIQDVFRALVNDEARTRQIAADVALAVRGGRNVLVLTQWTDHLDALAVELQQRGVEPLVLKGGLGKKARAAVIDRLNADPAPTGQLLLATGSYLGEGFDSPSLDPLFLAFPLAFKGRVVQYIGRILRANDIKVDVEVHDYLDPGPVFRKMHTKRLATYSTLGFGVPSRR